MSREVAEQAEVKITVRTTIFQGDEQDSFELTTFGRLNKKGNSFYLRYEEILEVGNIKTTVKFSENEAVILRSGAINMRLAFERSRQMKGHYETPYGMMDTLTDTKKLDHQQTNENEGKLDLIYDFMIQEDHAGTYHMEITYKGDTAANEHR